MTREHRIRPRPHNHIEVAGRATVHAGIALAGQPNALAVARARLDAKLDGLGALTVPSPWQVGQSLVIFPVPPQRGQVMLNFMRPPICVTLPVP